MARTKIAVVGVGKIAVDQHLPVIAANDGFELVGLVSQRGVSVAGVPTFRTAPELYAAIPEVEAVAICTPPHVRHTIAREALAAGKHVMLEKPPAATVSEMHDLTTVASAAGRTIFATWHSAHNAAVDEAKRRLAGARILKLHIDWKEDVCYWHPGQDWVWDAGNVGVFDPGINALSIVTRVLPGSLFVKSARLDFPENRDTPIAACLTFSCTAATAGAELTGDFDWRGHADHWNIDIETEGQSLRIGEGGTNLYLNGALSVESPKREYARLYERFKELLDAGEFEMDAAPFQLVADAFLIGARRVVAPFYWK